jgi:hypothetical protein
MILHLSKQLADRLKCQFSMEGMSVVQAGRLDAWSGHCFRIGRIEYVIMMNDACLFSILMPAKGLTSVESFLDAFLPRVAKAWQEHGGNFDCLNQEVIILKRSNKSLIGSMTEAVKMIKFYAEFDRLENPHKTPLDLEERLNNIPYKAIGFENSHRLLTRLLAKN